MRLFTTGGLRDWIGPCVLLFELAVLLLLRAALGAAPAPKGKSRENILFRRSACLTLGILLLVLPILGSIKEWNQSGAWPLIAWVLLFGLPPLGGLLIVFAITTPDSRIRLYIPATENGFISAVLTLPLYLILNGLRRKKFMLAWRRFLISREQRYKRARRIHARLPGQDFPSHVAQIGANSAK